ncbi:hypothetical protein SD81_017905 [Tolypothrix campylonemoides VB511288]|nr:hypothetical protein SD81_017905 [Tolypothrix campylonemoides VB511288]
MNEQSAYGKPKLEPLPCSAIVYRALLKKRWINEDTGIVEAGAYFLREKEKDRGLSVNIAASCSPQQCAQKFDKCFAVASLHVGRIRELGLDVIADKYDHAYIKGLPYKEDNLAETERLAGLLAKQSRIIWLL